MEIEQSNHTEIWSVKSIFFLNDFFVIIQEHRGMT